MQVKLSLAICWGYFLFFLLYYLLLLAREVERVLVNTTEWRHLLGITTLYIFYKHFPIRTFHRSSHKVHVYACKLLQYSKHTLAICYRKRSVR